MNNLSKIDSRANETNNYRKNLFATKFYGFFVVKQARKKIDGNVEKLQSDDDGLEIDKEKGNKKVKTRDEVAKRNKRFFLFREFQSIFFCEVQEISFMFIKDENQEIKSSTKPC